MKRCFIKPYSCCKTHTSCLAENFSEYEVA